MNFKEKFSDFNINKKSRIPMYYQIYNYLYDKILNNEFDETTPFPYEMTLCEIFNVSRITIREALRELELNGYIERRPGKGTFVTQKPVETEITLQKPYSIFDWAKEKYMNTQIKVLCNELIVPPKYIQNKLGINVEKVLYIERFTTINGEPMVLAKAYYPYDIFKKIDNETIMTTSFTKIVEDLYKIKILRKEMIIEADVPDNRIIKLLRIGENEKKVIQFMRSTWYIEYQSSKRIIYHEAYFHRTKGKFMLLIDQT
jgi:GntR family transcriptional regulator